MLTSPVLSSIQFPPKEKKVPFSFLCSPFFYTLLSAPMPLVFRRPEMLLAYGLPRGVAGRRAAIKFVLGRTE